jgi:GT2 family glycosyltransferase/glycosyltransferase involved in cell wall biosynthesis/SAM-dependent methyltransferase
VAISILNWNGWRDTLECLESVRRLDYPNFLTVVVDNGSWDDSAEKIRAWARETLPDQTTFVEYKQEVALAGGDANLEVELDAAESPNRLVLIRNKENLGFTGGNNLSISYALRRGFAADYVFLLNNDVFLEPDCLTQLVAADRRADAGMIGATLKPVEDRSDGGKTREPNAASAKEEFDGLIREEGSRPPRLENRQISESLGKHSAALDAGGDLIPVTWACGGALLVRRDLLEGVKQIQGNYLDDRLFVYGEEMALALAACKLGYKTLLAKRAVGYHRGSASTGGHWGPLYFYYNSRNMFYDADYMPKFERLRFRLMYPLKGAGRVVKYFLKGPPRSARAVLWGMIDAYRGVTGKWRNHDREANLGRGGGFVKTPSRDVMKITFIAAPYPWRPMGALRVVYEYANCLAARGHDVTIVHARLLVNGAPSSPRAGIVRRIHCAGYALRDVLLKPSVRWQALDSRIHSTYVKEPLADTIPDGDAVIAGVWETAGYVRHYPREKGEKFNLIQHYAVIFGNTKEQVHDVWKAQLHNILISKWLYNLAQEIGCSDTRYIPNGIDATKFRFIRPLKERPLRVAMLFHTLDWKGSADGIRAIEVARRKYPQLQVVFFSAQARPSKLPSWIEFHRDPPQGYLVEEIYNGSRVFLCASWSEGFALPPAEAMACGCALVSTDCGGNLDYAEHEKTALLSPPRNPEMLASNLLRLLDDDVLRLRIAQAGIERIRDFTWERSTSALERAIQESVQQCRKGQGTRGQSPLAAPQPRLLRQAPGMQDFDAASYWEDRLRGNVSLEKVGHLGLGKNYNAWLYRVRRATFRRTVRSLNLDLPNSSVLDIGSGTGFYIRLWKELGAREIVGLDITSAAIEHLRSQFPGHLFHRADIGETCALPGDPRFAVVSAFDVLFHIVDDLRYRTAIANIHSLLQPGGLFLFSDVFVRHKAVGCQHCVWRLLNQTEQVLTEAGFEVLSRRPVFVLMSAPVDTRSRTRKLAWGALQKIVSRSELAGKMAGAVLYPLEILLSTMLRESACTKLMVCRKKTLICD